MFTSDSLRSEKSNGSLSLSTFPPSFHKQTCGHQRRALKKKKKRSSNPFLRVSRSFGAKSEESNPETESTDRKAATGALTYTFYPAETTDWTHGYYAAGNFESRCDPIACDPLSILRVCRASNKPKPKKKKKEIKTS